MHCCVIIFVVGMIIEYVFMKKLPVLKKRAMKIGAPNFSPSYHSSSVVQTASNWNLQKLLKSKLQFMRYCNLKFGYNKASVKSTTLQNCAGKKKHTLPIKTTPKFYLMEHKMCLAICIVTKPYLGKVCTFLPIMLKYICAV